MWGGGWSGHRVTSHVALSSRHHVGAAAPPQLSDVMAEPDLVSVDDGPLTFVLGPPRHST